MRRALLATRRSLGVLLRALPHLLGGFAWRFAWRNVGRNPRRTVIVGSAISVGLAGVLLAMAINYGMVFQMVQTAIESELGHVQVHGLGFDDNPGIEIRIDSREGLSDRLVEGLPSVLSWAPRVRSEGLVYSPRASVGISLVGIDPARESGVSVLASSVVEGEYLDGASRRILLGERLAARLQVEVGDKVVVSAQDVNGEMAGEAYRVGGTFRTASRELDESVVYVRIDESQQFLGLGDAVSEYVLVAHRQRDADILRDALIVRLGGDVEVRTWKELRPLLVAMIDLFSQMGWYIYGTVFVAMAFGIANVLLMSVYERIREIGILTAIGLQPARLVATILAESLLLTLVGVAIGLAAGVGLVMLLSDGIGLSAWAEGLTTVGAGTKIVPVLRLSDLGIPMVVAVLTALFASLWPALRAVRIRPAEAVRHV